MKNRLLKFIVSLIFISQTGRSRPLLDESHRVCNIYDDKNHLVADRFRRPQCFTDWHKLDLEWVSEEMKKSINYNLHFTSVQNQTHSGSECKPRFHSIPLNGKGSQMWWPHFAHVSEILFYFYSTVLWQTSVFNVHGNVPCVYSLSIGNHSSIWNASDDTAHTQYIKHLVSTIENEWKIKIIQYKNCLNDLILPANTVSTNYASASELFSEENTWPPGNFYPPLWLLHPTDSLQLGSSVLQSDPCEFSNQATTLLSTGLHILLLNRKQNRQVTNLASLLQFFTETSIDNRTVQLVNLSSFISSHPSSFNNNSSSINDMQHKLTVAYFEKKSFHQQAQLMRQADVLLTVHGAAVANIVFMRPCSVVIEVFPWVYHSPEYYTGLAKRAGLIYFEWQEHYHHTDLFTDSLSEVRCKEVFNQVVRISKYNIHGGDTLTQADSDRANHACFSVENCRMCAQYYAIKGVTVSQDRLSTILQQAVSLRQRCIAENPLYNSSASSSSSSSATSYYPFSQHHAYKDGMLIRSSNQKSVFLLERGKKRPFAGGRAFMNMGFDFDAVKVIVDPWEFDRIPLGATIG